MGEDAENRRDESADALEAMADSEGDPQSESLDAAGADERMQTDAALASLAAGENIEPPVEEPSQAAHPDQQDQAPDDAWAAEAAPPADAEERRARQAVQQQRMAQAHGLQFKKTMIPLLIVVGVILLILSATTGIILLFTEEAALQEMDTSMLRRHGPALILASCPLALILLCGAWWLHLDIKRAG